MFEINEVNGSTFIYSPLPYVETASIGIFFRVGSRFEKKKLKGIAHFLEHMVFKGSKRFSHLQLKREIEGRGGSLNAFTSQEITAYYTHFLQKNLVPTLDIILDIVQWPLLRTHDIDKERNVILEEIKMYNDLPSSRATILLNKLLWEGHPLGEEVIGYAKTVKKIKRGDLCAFRDKYYASASMVVSFSGNFPRHKINNILKKKILNNNRPAPLKTATPQPYRGVGIKIEKKNLQQSHLCIGFRGFPYLSPHRIPLELINVILGTNMSSRLFEELREKKSLCYDISTEVRKFKDSGAFVIHTGLDKSKILIALSAVLKVLDRLKERLVSQKELSRAKDYLLGQTAMILERPQERMFYLAEQYFAFGKIYTFEEIKQLINAVTPSTIKELANKVFNFRNICISCVGDIEENIESKIRKTVI